MSDSIPANNPAPTKPPPRRGWRSIPPWWLMSAAFHVVVLGWLILFSPVRVINLQTSKAEFTAGSARIREVIDLVRDRQAEMLASSVRDLQEIQLELAALDARKMVEFEKFSGEFATEAPELAEQAQEAAAKAQAEALATQGQAATNLDALRQSPTPESFKALDGIQHQVETAQDRVGQPQDRALQVLAMSDSSYEAARQAQAEANALQRRAAKAQVDARAVLDDARYQRDHARNQQKEATRLTESLEKFTSETAPAKTKLEKAQAEATQAESDATQSQATVLQAKTEAERLKTTAAERRSAYDRLPAKDPARPAAKEASTLAQTQATDARRQADQAQTRADQARRQTESTRRRVEQAQQDLRRAEQRVTEQQTRVDRFQTNLVQALTKADAVQQKLLTNQVVARSLQAEAQLAQAKARQVLAAARLSAATNLVARLTNSVELSTNVPTDLPNVYGMNLADLYQTAVATEGRLTETYRRIRATELAMLRQIPRERALQLTEVARVVRPELRPALQASVTAGEDVPAAREAVQAASSEIGAMVTLGTSLLFQAKGLDRGGSGSGDGAPISLDWIRAQTDQVQAMEGLAAEDESARAKDLSAAMQGPEGNGAGNGAGQGAGQGAGRPGAAGGGNLPGAPGGRAGFGYGGPPPFPNNLKALPGRKIKASATPATWMYVDSWYILGPFDNARRENLEKKFPPETVVDLNATYTGKDDKPIRWEFYQAPDARITPPFDHFYPERKRAASQPDHELRRLEYIIYYAYTELYFETACDLWIAIGSDDFSKLWIEDQLVWASGKQQKSWRVDEGLRKVHFRAGLNRVLYRVENGWHATDFSLVVSLK